MTDKPVDIDKLEKCIPFFKKKVFAKIAETKDYKTPQYVKVYLHEAEEILKAAEAYRKIWPILEPVLKEAKSMNYDCNILQEDNHGHNDVYEGCAVFYEKAMNAMNDINKILQE